MRFGQRRANVHHSEAKSQANKSWLIPARKRTLGLGGEVALNVLAKEVKATIYTASWFDLLSKSKTPQSPLSIPTTHSPRGELSELSVADCLSSFQCLTLLR